ncbi:phosphatase PAP2 family protein [Nisaea sp.]|uniref:phosphatase PAP2 family protein n=3 Tax=Nisaea sp. TaxID=2024842 RepID=UPI00326504AD
MSSGAEQSMFRVARFNSFVFQKMMDYSEDDFVAQNPGADHPEFWHADLQAHMYLRDFLERNPGWMDEYKMAAERAGAPAQQMSVKQLKTQTLHIIDATSEREGRFAEAIHQDDGNSAIGYWLGMIGVDPVRHPATYLMIRVARLVGEHVVMCLKGHYRGSRPSIVCPAIVPLFDPPATPSFPSGHALQSYLISNVIAGALLEFPQSSPPSNEEEPGAGPLYDLAKRVAYNRVVAGVHFPCDNEAGRRVAYQCFLHLKNIPSFWTDQDSLKARVQREFPHYAS